MSKFIRTNHVVDAVNWQFDALSNGSSDAESQFNCKTGDSELTTDYQRGIKQGHSEGFRAGAAHEVREHTLRQGQTSARLDVIIGTMQRQFSGMEQQVAQVLTDLAFSIARQVIRTELTANPGAIVPVVREALSALAGRAMHPVIWLHPNDISLVRSANEEMLTVRGCRIDVDPAITRGGCRVESESMTIDATIETRWQRALASMGYSGPQDAPFGNGQEHVTATR